MYPWIWYWAPIIKFPLSGDVAQDIEPDFFSRIKPDAGDPEMERRVFEHASYGKQLGIVMEAVLSRANGSPEDGPQAAASHQRLRELYLEIEEIKAQIAAGYADDLIARLDRLKNQYPQEFERVQNALQTLESPDSTG